MCLGQGSRQSYNQTRIQLVCTTHRWGGGLETYSVSCSWWLAASSRKPGCLPASPGRRTTMTQGHQKRLHCFSPALPGGGRLRSGQVSPLLSSCPTEAAAAALEHSKGRTAEMLFNAQARRQGPAGFSCWYSAESARASHVTPGRQADRQTGSLLGFLARCHALLAFTSCKHRPLVQSFLLQFPLHLRDAAFAAQAVPQPAQTPTSSHQLRLPQQHHPSQWSCQQQLPFQVEGTNRRQGIVLETQNYLTATLQTLIKGDWEPQLCLH